MPETTPPNEREIPPDTALVATVKGILTVLPARVAAVVRSWPDNGESLP